MIIALQTLVFFRESLFAVLDRFLRPYYKHFSLTFDRHTNASDDEESEDHVFAEFDDEKGVIFFPPMYAQRYAAVSDCLMDERWCEKLEKVVDFGHHDMSFLKYLKEVPGIKCILGVDIECIPLRCSSDLLGCDDYVSKRESPLQVSLFQGNAADPDYRLIGCDAVIAIEMIEHMLPHDLERFVHTVFGFIKPRIAVFTTPNGDFNELFKSLEKNGLRRLDHFFEWSREQFYDWCTNIVVRYPQYTVSCKGIGPGPPGTLHYGCCSQLALFVAKDYHKQQDLNLNSLALVARAPTLDVCDAMGCVDSPDTLTEANMLCASNDIESYTQLMFSDNQSCVTLVLSPAYSLETLMCKDEASQCNLDTEIGKSFLMFDDELCFNILIPRRRVHNRVYEIGDVNCRLNCTTLQVKKFSKATQKLMARNKLDTLVHTREVVDDIRHLTKMLNFSNEPKGMVEGGNVWNNINWGENAPYWNQYYKVVREYTYPFETKSDECRILDLISDEINRLVDTQFEEDFSMDVNRLEIPIDHLMRVVQHVTDDVDKVKDLLEWNGYEVVDDVVIHSRLVVENASGSRDDDWHDNDTFSDWDTDIHSTSISEGSTIIPDYNGRYLHRALDQKVRKLRSILTADEDITSELDRVVCRLMKLALRASKRRQQPLSMRWMQCKLFELLTLTEKSIERKKRHFVDTFTMQAICYDEEIHEPNVVLKSIEEDTAANEIVNKYRHFVRSSEYTNTSEDRRFRYFDALEVLSHKSSGDIFKECESSDLNFDEVIRSPSLVDIESVANPPVHTGKMFFKKFRAKNETPLSRTQAWIDEDLKQKTSPRGISSGDTDHSMINIGRQKNKKSHKKHKVTADGKNNDLDVKRRKRTRSKTSHDKQSKSKNEDKYKNRAKTSNTKIKKASENKSSYNILIKTYSKQISAANLLNYDLRFKKSLKHYAFQSSKLDSQNSAETMIRLQKTIEKDSAELRIFDQNTENECLSTTNLKELLSTDIASTKNSLCIDIVSENNQETIALRRSIGTDADDDPTIFEQETFLGSMSNVMKIDSYCNKADIETENIQSQTIFLNDINEPSTSKGVRHVSMDVQCGPDLTNPLAMLSATTSFSRIPNFFNTGVKIEDSTPKMEVEQRSSDFGTITNDKTCNTFKTLTPRTKTVGIKIKDSDTIITDKVEGSTMTQEVGDTYVTRPVPPRSSPRNYEPAAETTMLKTVSSRLKMVDSGSEFCESIDSSRKSALQYAYLSKNTSDSQLNCSASKEVAIERRSLPKYMNPKLCCGGVHVHSFKDRQVCEDVIYQGEWQRYNPKSVAKKRGYNNVVQRRACEAASKKYKLSSKENIKKDVKSQQIKRLPIVNKIKVKEVPKVDSVQKKTQPVSQAKLTKCNRIATKVATKLAASSSLPKSSNKTSYVTKKPSATSCVAKKDTEKIVSRLKKSYLPLYLKRKLAINNKSALNKDSDKTIIANKNKPISIDTLGAKPDIKKLNKELLGFDIKPRENIRYVVFRNDIEVKKNSSTDCEEPVSDREVVSIRDNIHIRSLSPQSQNSSACSSLNSVATVRARPNTKLIPDRRFPASSNKSNLGGNQPENNSVKNKKFTKRSKITKKPQDKDFDNKENLPESSRKSKELDKNAKHSLMRNKNVFRAQITTESTSQPAVKNVSKHKQQTNNKSNIKIPCVPSSSEKRPTSATSSKPSISNKQILNSSSSLLPDSKSDKSSHESEIVISSTSHAEENTILDKPHEVINDVIVNIVDSNLLKEWMHSSYKSVVDSHTSNILAAMRQLVEERLDFIDRSSDCVELDSKTVILGENQSESQSVSQAASFNDINTCNASFNTVIDIDCLSNFNLTTAESMVNLRTSSPLIENVSTMSISDTRGTLTDFDMLSFKSLASTSKLSEYFLAESTLNNGITSNITDAPVANSVHDIFERKPDPPLQNPPGALAVQAFSGFSMNAELIAGDQPDRVNIIDSETGSIAMGYQRQATSEEVFISGRSSDSYESCFIDEDTVVPNWLFQIISQQHSVDEEEEEEPEERLPMPMPLPEPMFDVNGNVMEPGMGASAGAGDGRGIHSDHSQDSSGRGTSLSSSVTSSGPQSEAILIDPSAFTAQYDLMREPVANPAAGAPNATVNGESPDTSFATADGSEIVRNNGILNSAGDPQRTIVNLAASDVDADVSSIDTDVPDLDSSDN